MNYYEHHIGDYAEATSHLTFVEDAAYSRLIRKYYATEKPLPADIKAVQRLVSARTKEEQQAVETVLNEFFALKDDGWHNKRCDEDLEKYREGEPEREAKREHEASRSKRHREERARLFEALREIEITPAWNMPIKELRALHAQHCNGPETQPVTAPVTLQASQVSTTETSSYASPVTSLATPVTATHPPFPSTIPQSPFPSPNLESSRTDARARGTTANGIGVGKDEDSQGYSPSDSGTQGSGWKRPGTANGPVTPVTSQVSQVASQGGPENAWRDVTECDPIAYQAWLDWRADETDVVPARVRLQDAKFLGGKGPPEAQRAFVDELIRRRFKRLHDPVQGFGGTPSGNGLKSAAEIAAAITCPPDDREELARANN